MDSSHFTLFFFVLSFAVVLVELSQRVPTFRQVGSAIIAIVLGAILSNVGILPNPSEARADYGQWLSIVAPLSIFFLIASVDVREVLRIGPSMIIAMIAAIVSIVGGVSIGFWSVLQSSDMNAKASELAGIFAGGHVGGSANFNGLAIEYGVSELSDLYGAMLVIDNLALVVWMGVCILTPKLASPKVLSNFESGAMTAKTSVCDTTIEDVSTSERPITTVIDIAMLAGAGFGTLWVSTIIEKALALIGWTVPFILLVSVIAVFIGAVASLRTRMSHQAVSGFLVLLFLILVGAQTNFAAVFNNVEYAKTLVVFIFVVMFLHGIVMFSVSRVFNIDLAASAVASQACFGGPVSAAAVARAIGANRLVLPAVIVGSFGAVIGNFLGVAVATFLG